MVAANPRVAAVPPAWLTAPAGRAFSLTLASGAAASAVRVERDEHLRAAAAELGLSGTALVIVGGAGRMEDSELDRMEPLFREVLGPFAERQGAILIDGGTDSGVMGLAGQARRTSSFVLVGVVAGALAAESPDPESDAAPLEPNHSHFLFVPGTRWGDESPWLARFASVVAHGQRSATVLVNGGDVTLRDAEESVGEGRPVIVVTGSGGVAETLSDTLRGGATDARASTVVASGLVHAADVAAIGPLLDNLFAGGTE